MIDLVKNAQEWMHKGSVDHAPSRNCAACHPDNLKDLIALLEEIHQETRDEIEDRLGDTLALLLKSFSGEDEFVKGFTMAYDLVRGKNND